MPRRYRLPAVLLLTTVAAILAFTHMDNIPAYLVIAPGYLVQAWLFETHHALGGFGYQLTMVGVSAVVWGLIVLSLTAAVRFMIRFVRRLS